MQNAPSASQGATPSLVFEKTVNNQDGTREQPRNKWVSESTFSAFPPPPPSRQHFCKTRNCFWCLFVCAFSSSYRGLPFQVSELEDAAQRAEKTAALAQEAQSDTLRQIRSRDERVHQLQVKQIVTPSSPPPKKQEAVPSSCAALWVRCPPPPPHKAPSPRCDAQA